MPNKDTYDLKTRYVELMQGENTRIISFCVHRNALRAMCLTGRKYADNSSRFKLVQSNIILSMVLSGDDSMRTAIRRSIEAAQGANRTNEWAAATAALVAANIVSSFGLTSNRAQISAAEQENYAGIAAQVVANVSSTTDSGVESREADSNAIEAFSKTRHTPEADSEEASAALTEAQHAATFAAEFANEAKINTKIGIDALFKSCLHDISNKNNPNLLRSSLWAPEFENHGKEIENKLIKLLIEAEMDFLAEDLSNLLDGRQALNRIKNYRLNLSEVITQDAELLRRAIVLGEDTEPSQNVRILLLGSGGAGKSELGDRLKGIKYKGDVRTATRGVEIHTDDSVDLNSLLSDYDELFDGISSPLTTYLWDFGGQKLFHGLHATFMHENAVYLLVVDSRHEQAVDYWLHQVQHLAGPGASVLIVTNEYENCELKQNETRLRRLFPKLISDDSFHYFPCIQDLSPEFVNHLLNVCMDSRKRIFSTTVKVIDELKAKFSNQQFLYTHEIDNIIGRTFGNADKSDDSIHQQLKQLGKVVYLDGHSGKVCLNPDWLIDSAYTLINSALIKNNKGKISKTEIHNSKNQIFGGNAVSDEDIGQLLAYIEQVGQCTKIDDFYLFPDATGSNEPEDPNLYDKRATTLDILFDLPYFPIGLHASFVNSLHGKWNLSIEPDSIWREGFILNGVDTQNRSFQIATIEYEMRNGAVRVHTLLDNPRLISETLDQIKMYLENVMASTGIEKPVTPYISYGGSYKSMNWEEFKIILNQNGQTIPSAIINFTGALSMGNKYVNKDNSFQGGLIQGGKDNIQTSTISYAPVDKESILILATVIKRYLADKDRLSPEELAAVTETNSAIAQDDHSKLPQLWNAFRNATSFAANASTAAQFAIDHKVPILAALVTASAKLTS